MKSNILAKDSINLVFNGWRIKEEADLVYFEGCEVTGEFQCGLALAPI
jgi:hypothetical protein